MRNPHLTENQNQLALETELSAAQKSLRISLERISRLESEIREQKRKEKSFSIEAKTLASGLTAKIRETEQQLSAERTRFEEAQTTIKRYQMDWARMTTKENQARAVLGELDQRWKKAQHAALAYQAKARELSGKLKQSEAKCLELQPQLAEARDASARMQGLVFERDNSIRTLRAELAEIGRVRDEARAEAARLALQCEQASSFAKQMDEARTRSAQAEGKSHLEMQRMREALKADQARYRGLAARHEEEAKMLRNQLEKAEKSLASANELQQQLVQQLEHEQQHRDEALSEASHVQEELRTREKELQDALVRVSEIRTLREELEAARGDANRMSQAAADLADQLSTVKWQLEELEADKASLRKQLAEELGRRDEAVSHVARLQQDLQGKQGELEAALAEAAELRAKAAAEHESAQANTQMLDSELKRLRDALEGAETRAEGAAALRTELAGMNRQLQDLENQKTVLWQQLEHERQRHGEALSEAARVKQELRISEKELKAAIEQAAEFRKKAAAEREEANARAEANDLELTRLRETLEQTESRADAGSKENTALARDLAAIQHQLTETEGAKEALRQQFEANERELERTNLVVAEKERVAIASFEELVKAERNGDALGQQVAELQRSFHEAHANLLQSRSRIQELERERLTTEALIQRFVEEREQLVKRGDTAYLEAASAAESLAQERNLAHQLKADLARQADAAASALRELSIEKELGDAGKLEMSALRQAMQGKDTELTEARLLLEKMNEEVRRTEAVYQRFSEERAALVARGNQGYAELEDAKRELAGTAERVTELEDRIRQERDEALTREEKWNEMLDEMGGRLESVITESRHTQEEYLGERAHTVRLETELKQRQVEIEGMRQELSLMREIVSKERSWRDLERAKPLVAGAMKVANPLRTAMDELDSSLLSGLPDLPAVDQFFESDLEH